MTLPYKCISACIILILYLHIFAYGQFRQFETETKIASNWIRCIYKDQTGYIWLGTKEGLNRFDGETYLLFYPTSEEGAIYDSVAVNCIVPTDFNKIYIGTDVGLFLFDTVTHQFTQNDLVGKRPVTDLVIDSKKRLWVGFNKGVIIIEENSQRILKFNEIDIFSQKWHSNYVNKIYQDRSGRIWIGTRTNLIQTDENLSNIQNVRFLPQDNPVNNTYEIMSLAEDVDGAIWVGTARQGFYKWENQSNDLVATKKGNGNIIALLVDHQNVLWVARGQKQGLAVFDLKKLKKDNNFKGIEYFPDHTVPGSISDNSIFSLYEDDLKNIWVGTFGMGINYYSRNKKEFKLIKSNVLNNWLSDDLINTLYEDGEYLWIGTEGGMDRWHKKTHKIERLCEKNEPFGFGSYPVFSIEKEKSSNDLWIGTWANGMFHFDSETEKFTQFLPKKVNGNLTSENIFAILDDGEGTLWLGTIGGGIVHMDLKTQVFSKPNEINQNIGESINKILKLTDGRILISDHANLILINPPNNEIVKIRHLSGEDERLRGTINDIYQDSKGHIWIATSLGLEVLNLKTKEFTFINPVNSGDQLIIKAIHEDRSANLWLTTGNGLIKFINGVSMPNEIRFLFIDQKEGISGNEFQKRAIYVGPEGYMSTGTTTGVTRFNPDKIRFNTSSNPIVINDVRELKTTPDSTTNFRSLLNNGNRNNLTLTYDKNYLEFHFAILSYLNPDKNRYQYRMLGYDHNWVDANHQNKAVYTNLSPGHYKFEVKGTNNDGIPCSNIASISFTIKPPWWKSKRFIVTGILLIIGILINGAYFKMKSQEKRNKELMDKVDERTLELVAANEQLEKRRVVIEQQHSALAEYKDDLELAILERTQELQIAKEQAEESDRLKSSFLSNLTHEVRTPMNAIMGLSDIITDPETSSAEKEEYVTLIHKNCHRLLNIVDDVLDMAMLKANQLKLKQVEFDFSDLLKDLYEYFQKQIDTSIIDFKLLLPKTPQKTMVYGDPNRLRQVLDNFINNAIKFTSQGEIAFGFYRFDDQIEVFIKDSGIGIKKDKLVTIFEHFYKIEESNKALYEGTGIGLALCKQLLELHGSDIQVESENKKGTIFRFKLSVLNTE